MMYVMVHEMKGEKTNVFYSRKKRVVFYSRKFIFER